MNHFYKIFSTPNKLTNRLKNAAASFALLFASFSTFNAQVSIYTFGQSSGTYTPITGTVLGTATGNVSATNLNSEIFPVTLPFNFIFNGASYGSLNVSTNGFVSFGATAPGTTVTSPISSTTTTAYDGAVSAFGRDLNSVFDVNGVTGNISWDVVGTAPNREIVIQWKDFRPTNITSVTSVYTFSFQVRLQETSNVVKTVYNSGSYVIGNTAYNSTAQIGLRGTSVADFNNRLNATTLEFVNSTAGTANSSTQAFHTVNAVPGMPSAGLTYTWTPPSCLIPTSFTSPSSTTSSINVQWVAPVIVPAGGYEIYYSTSNTAPTSSTTPSITGISSTSQTISSLTPTTMYYIWVRSSCSGTDKSAWTANAVSVYTPCVSPAITATTTETVCINGQANLTATADAGATVKWYTAQTGGNAIATGNAYTTPPLASTTSYYVSAAEGGGVNSTGLTTAASTSGYTLEAGSFFNVLSQVKIDGVYVYPIGTGVGSVVIALQDGNVSPATTLQTITVNLTGTAAPYVKTFVPLNWVVPIGSNYKLMMISRSGGVASLVRESGATWGTYPITLTGLLSIVNGNCCSGNTTSTSYYYFYDWQVSTGCESARQPVVASVDATCTLSVDDIVSKTIDMSIHPNPVSDNLFLKSKHKVTEIEIYSATGQKVLNLKETNITSINLQQLTAGVYLVNITLDNGQKTSKKIIKK